mgnify:CR=1 FL=1
MQGKSESSFSEKKRPNPIEEETTYTNQTSSSGEESVEESKIERVEGLSRSTKKLKALYNDAFGFEMPQGIGIVVPKTPLNLGLVDFSKLPLLRSTIEEAGSRVLL